VYYGTPLPGRTVATPRPVAAEARPPVRVVPGGTYRVVPGDTLYAVARRLQVPPRDLIDANALTPPYRLTAGQTLAVPAARYHVVQAGESLYGISRRHGVDLHSLARENTIEAPFTIRAGQSLRLPAPVQAPAQLADRFPPPSGLGQPAGAPPAAGGAVVATPLPPPPGQPSPSPQPAGVLPSAAEPGPATQPAGQQPAPAEAESQLPGPEAAEPMPEPEPPRTAAAPPPPPPPARGEGRFLWPAEGPLISRYGPKPNGLHNDGINIRLARGSPVRAAENGVVAYAGNELKGFGNLVLIRHADGWVSAYAHADELLVRLGDTVRRGQIVARAGSSGGVSEPQLHFELRRGASAVDPLPHLGTPGSARATVAVSRS